MMVLILGDGLLGKEIVKQTGWDYISRRKDGIDANNFISWSHKLLFYDVIINCIANTDTYSDNKESHWDINYRFVSELVDYCRYKSKKLVHISTDYVYENSIPNASENDIPIHGNTWYSYTKLLADGYVQLKSDDYLVCRGTHKPKPFPYEKAWEDQMGNFDYVDVIASQVIKLVNMGLNGLYNIGTEPKYMIDLAKQTRDAIPTKKHIHVPANTTMSLEKLNKNLS